MTDATPKRGRGQPAKNGKRIHINLGPERLARIEASWARKRLAKPSTTRTQAIEQLLDAGLAAEQEEDR